MSDDQDGIFRSALLSHADKENIDIPYPHILNNVLRQLKDDPDFHYLPQPIPLWRSIWDKLISIVNDFINPLVVVTAVFVLAVSLYITCSMYCYSPSVNDLINLSYNEVDVQYWENVSSEQTFLRFSESSHPSFALQAFNAGLWKGRQSLLSSPNKTSWVNKAWSKTQWASYYDLGRWTVLLESVCRSLPDVPEGFWDKQKVIFAQLSQAIVERRDKNDELEGVVIEWVLSQFEEDIGPLLEQLPNAPLAEKLAEKLKFMREGLVIE